jgi:3-hydroxymyristoyl/3-hydroxydecanoyl-(acyl carrier protein) dehydratase
MNPQPPFELEYLLSILPHRPPFLFVDRVTELDPGKRIAAERLLRPEEPQFAGHFPGRAIMPGVLVTEALAQTSGLLLGLSEKVTGAAPPQRPRMFVLAANNMKYKHPAAPGDKLELRAQADGNFAGLFRFNVEASAGRNLIACGSLTLAQVEGKP